MSKIIIAGYLSKSNWGGISAERTGFCHASERNMYVNPSHLF